MEPFVVFFEHSEPRGGRTDKMPGSFQTLESALEGVKKHLVRDRSGLGFVEGPYFYVVNLGPDDGEVVVNGHVLDRKTAQLCMDVSTCKNPDYHKFQYC